MSKFVTYAVTPEEAVHGVQLAIKHAVTGRPGPACVVMRNYAVSRELDPSSMNRLYPTSGYLKPAATVPPSDEIKKAVRIILEAKNPVIIAGNGVHISKAYAELKDLAEMLGSPVATSYKGLSSFPGVHPLSIGMMGTFGHQMTNTIVAEADLLLVAGCHLGPSDTRYENPAGIDPLRQKILQLDIDPRNAGWTYPIDLALIGNLNLVLKELIEALRGNVSEKNRERISVIEKRKQEEKFCEAAELYSDQSPILPQRIIKEIQDNVDPSTIITLDAGNNRIWMSHFFKPKDVGTIFCPGGGAGMAWGPPASLTAKLLHPDKPVLSVSGDGGFAMMTHVLSTAVQYRLPVVFLVMNNSALGMVHNIQRIKGRVIATEFIETDFVKIAQGYGCQGLNITQAKDLGPAINNALRSSLSASKPFVLDVATDNVESFLKVTALEDYMRLK